MSRHVMPIHPAATSYPPPIITAYYQPRNTLSSPEKVFFIPGMDLKMSFGVDGGVHVHFLLDDTPTASWLAGSVWSLCSKTCSPAQGTVMALVQLQVCPCIVHCRYDCVLYLCRFRSLAGSCCRVMRLDMILLAAHHLHSLSAVSHICEEEDVMEVNQV